MNHQFTYIQPIKLSLLARIFGKRDPRNALIRINNLFAQVEHPSEVDIDQVKKVHAEYGVKTIVDVSLLAGKLYAKYLASLFSELEQTELKQRDLDALQIVQHSFMLSDAQVNRINLMTGLSIYRRALAKALSDEVLTQEEKRNLNHLGHQLNLEDSVIENILHSELQTLLDEKIEKALEDGEFSPQEQMNIEAFCRKFNISPVYSEQTQKAIDYAKRIWYARHGHLIPIQVDIALKAKEECYAKIYAEWWEVRRNAMPVWRSHNLPPEDTTAIAISYAPIVDDCLSQIDTGILYITSKRVVFIGHSVTTSIAYSKMIDSTQYKDGIKIVKEIGRSPYILGGQALYWGSLVKRLLFGTE